ncbi:MAG: hypothetical protein KGI38_11605 [Thaumarchaeota archaeon]|nr:hypothetical protein [Nitrososphaerota archaeon]
MKAEALPWLLEPSNPPVRMFTLTDILSKPADDKEVRAARQSTLSYRPVSALKKAQGKRGYWPPDDTCYNPKFTSTVWQLQLLGELGTPRTPWIDSAVERFLEQHQLDDGSLCPMSSIELERWLAKHKKGKRVGEPCLAGNMVRTLLVLGYGEDARVKKALDWLPEFQQGDGGWNCDYPDRKPNHSSFMSTIEPLWAYSEVPRSSWSRKMKRSCEEGAEFLLNHRLYKSHRDWRHVELRGLSEVFSGDLVTMFHFPLYYYYDALHALRVLTRLGYENDERIEDAVHLVLSKRTPEGKWLLDGDWSRERKRKDRKLLVAIEELNEPSKWVTLNCYRVLARTGDLEIPK